MCACETARRGETTENVFKIKNDDVRAYGFWKNEKAKNKTNQHTLFTRYASIIVRRFHEHVTSPGGDQLGPLVPDRPAGERVEHELTSDRVDNSDVGLQLRVEVLLGRRARAVARRRPRLRVHQHHVVMVVVHRPDAMGHVDDDPAGHGNQAFIYVFARRNVSSSFFATPSTTLHQK